MNTKNFEIFGLSTARYESMECKLFRLLRLLLFRDILASLHLSNKLVLKPFLVCVPQALAIRNSAMLKTDDDSAFLCSALFYSALLCCVAFCFVLLYFLQGKEFENSLQYVVCDIILGLLKIFRFF
uniref:Uncharacterized protein n=1 Tax=Glossina austeni TaxID=7395 RepID=A0A1A9UUU2_GLOAU